MFLFVCFMACVYNLLTVTQCLHFLFCLFCFLLFSFCFVFVFRLFVFGMGSNTIYCCHFFWINEYDDHDDDSVLFWCYDVISREHKQQVS